MLIRTVVAIISMFGALMALEARAAETVTVTTLEWPPYTSENLPKGGATTEIVRQAFAAAGMDVEVETVPWKRAIAMAENDEGTVAYFPGYHCRHVNGFVSSDPIGTGPLGFAENVNAPITWEDIDDIGKQKLRVGTVLGYSNTDEFDEKAGTGWIRAIPAADDVTNLRKLIRQRIDLAVIDKLVLSYLLATDPTLMEESESLVFDDKPLEEKTLFLCLVESESGLALRDRFNTGLAQIDIDTVVESYFREEF